MSSFTVPTNSNESSAQPAAEVFALRESVRVGLVCDRHWDELGEVTLSRGNAGAAEGDDTLRLSDFTGAVATNVLVGFGDLDAPDKEDCARLGAYVCPISISVAPTAAERASEDGPPPRRELPLGHTVIKRQYSERRAVGVACGAPPLIDPPLDSVFPNGNGLGDGCKVAVRGAGCPEAAMGQMAAQLDGLTWHGAQTFVDVRHLGDAFATLLAAHTGLESAHRALQLEHQQAKSELTAAHERLAAAHEETKQELADLRGRCLQLLERSEAEAKKEAEHQAIIAEAAFEAVTRLLRQPRYSHFVHLVGGRRDVNAADDKGFTALHTACEHGHTEVVKALIAANADVNAVDRKMSTPLHAASNSGFTDIVRTLIAANADVNVVDRNGSTPLHAANKYGVTGIVKVLIAAKANVNAVDKDGSAPLHAACFHGHTEIVKALIAANADVNAVDRNRGSPLYIAYQQRRFADIIKALERAGARSCPGSGDDCRRENIFAPFGGAQIS